MRQQAVPESVLTTPDRRAIYRALRLGAQVYITPASRAVDRITGQDYGCQFAAQELVFSGLARWRRGADWVVELRK